MIRGSHLPAVSAARRAGAVLCVLLVFLTGFVAVVHVHPDSAKTPQHSCSVCVLSHSGIAPIQIVVASPTLARIVFAQSAGISTSVIGTVADPSGAVVPNALVEIRNPVSGFERTATTDDAGRFAIPNVPFNPYHLIARGQGFAPYTQNIDVRSVVPV